MPGISIHAVDVARGVPAAGMRVRVFALAPHRRLLAEGRLGSDGALGGEIAAEPLPAGTYEVVFGVGEWLREAGGEAPFLDEVPFRFRLGDPNGHLHLPFKFTPWGFSLFRGA